MNRLLYILSCALFLPFLGLGQDAHFSQFNFAHQTLNPALNGLFDGAYKFGVQYRNQFNAVSPNAFQTMFANFESKVHISRNDYVTYSLDIMRDMAGSGNLSQTSGYLSLGYLKQLTNNKYGVGESFLSGSFRVGVGQNALDWSKFWFGRQFDPSSVSVNPALPTGENFSNNHSKTKLFADVGGGLMWYSVWGKRKSLYIGVAAYHLNRPNIGLQNAVKTFLYTRTSIHAGGEFRANREISILPSMNVQIQGPSLMCVSGFYTRYVNQAWDDIAFRLGLFTRVSKTIKGVHNDAVIASTAFEYRNFTIGLSYDVSTSSIIAADGGRGAWELALSYRNPNGQLKKPLTCPKL